MLTGWNDEECECCTEHDEDPKPCTRPTGHEECDTIIRWVWCGGAHELDLCPDCCQVRLTKCKKHKSV